MMAASLNVAPVSLGELLVEVPLAPAVAALPVGGVVLDSRRLSAGDLFLACAGGRHHGLNFLTEVLARRPVAVLAEPSRDWPAARIAVLNDSADVPVIAVPDLGRRAGELAARFFRNPGDRMSVVGITGTNGKTSCAHFLAQAVGEEEPCALVGTLGNGFPGRLEPATHTTPNAVEVQDLLADFLDRDAAAVAMEVSSHALHQHRVAGVAFDVAVFTNLTRDHLDYHGTMEAYGEAKARLFAQSGLRAAVINADDPFGQRLLTTLPAGVVGVAYGCDGVEHAGVDRWLAARDLAVTPEGLRMQVESSWGEGELRAAVVGRFNAYNLLAVLGVLLVRGMPLERALERVARVTGVPGRMELFRQPGRPAVVVDYAHTPDALEQLLAAVREHCDGRLICVFGCGGDRDAGKRPLMGALAERLADGVVLTDDNPRSEPGEAIVGAILAGMKNPATVQVQRDRAAAIAGAIRDAGPGDWVVVAGKGHEDYQLVGDLRLDFSDREQVRRVLAEGAA